MQQVTQKLQVLPQENPEYEYITTTLYELIEAIDEELQPGEEDLVVPVFFDLIACGQVKFTRNRDPQTHHAA